MISSGGRHAIKAISGEGVERILAEYGRGGSGVGRVAYCRRWLVGNVVSSLKRMFGSSVNAVKMENITQEIAIRINTHNKMLAVAREVIVKA